MNRITHGEVTGLAFDVLAEMADIGFSLGGERDAVGPKTMTKSSWQRPRGTWMSNLTSSW